MTFRNYHTLGISIGWAMWGTHQTWWKEFLPFGAMKEQGPWFLPICDTACHHFLPTFKRWPCQPGLVSIMPLWIFLAPTIFCNYQCYLSVFSPFLNGLKIELKHLDIIFESFVSNNLTMALVNKICEPISWIFPLLTSCNLLILPLLNVKKINWHSQICCNW